MYAVVFEFTLKDGVRDRYFELAAKISEEIANQSGFISTERFGSLNELSKVVSLST
jgi:heme-degrading monooxygenase HmoA